MSVNLAGALGRLDGLDVHVVTTDRSCQEQSVSKWDGVTVHRLAWAGGRTLPHAIGCGRAQLQEYLHRLGPDVVHAHDTYGLMVRGLAMPRVFTVHGFIHADTLIAGGRLARLRSWLWRRAELVAWADQPHIISISPYVRERLNGIARGFIHDIDNPVSEAFFNVQRREMEGRIFSAACLSPLKNTLGLIASFARLTAGGVDAELRLAGTTTSEEYDRRVRQLARQEGVLDRVAFLGHLSAEQIREELAAASVFALVSLQENSPMGIEEAMAAGVPVVTSNRCGMPYMVRDGESGFLVNPNDPDDIADRLRQLLEDDGLRAAMGKRGRQIAMDRFHPRRIAERTRQVYLRAIRDHKRVFRQQRR